MPRRPRPVCFPRLAPAIVLAVLLVIAACGGTSDVDQETFSSQLLERTNQDEEVVPEAVANCIAERVFGEFDQGEVNRIYRAATPTELDQSVRDSLTIINQECFEAQPPPRDGASPTTEGGSTTTSEDAGG